MRQRCSFLTVAQALIVGFMILNLGCTDPVSYEQVTVFPIETGNTWEYTWTYSTDNLEPSDVGYWNDTGWANVEVIRLDTMPEPHDSSAYVIQTECEKGRYAALTEEYNNNTEDGFYNYGYDGAFIGPPKLDPYAKYYFQFKDLRATSLPQLLTALRSQRLNTTAVRKVSSDVYYEDPPIKEIAYPIKTGTRWSYRSTELDHVFDMDREIVGRKIVEVPAGRFSCFEIKWYWDIDDDGEWDTDIEGYDYLGPVGYVKRTFLYLGIQVTDEHGNVINTWDATEQFILKKYSLN